MRHRRREGRRPLHLFALLGLGVAIGMVSRGFGVPPALATVNVVLGIAILGLLLAV